MKKKIFLFLCSSQYTVFNSINTVLNDPETFLENTDIVIFRRTDDMENIATQIKEKKIFRRVYELPFINRMSPIKLLLFFLLPKLFFDKLNFNKEPKPFLKNQYDILISQNYLYAALFQRINPNSDVWFIEDGLSSYTKRIIDPKKRSIYFKLANKFLFKKTLLADVKYQLLYMPEMYLGEDSRLKRLSTINMEKSLFNQIFDYKDNKLYSFYKYVYLGTPFNELKKLVANPNNVDTDFESKCRSIVKILMKTINNANCIYRSHPIENLNKEFYKNLCEFDIYRNMWEIECKNNINDNHVLVSFFSTASFTPKILYNKEPYVIFLYKILGVELFNADELIFKLKSIYKDPNKVIIVDSIDGLIEIIEKLDSVKNISKIKELN